MVAPVFPRRANAFVARLCSCDGYLWEIHLACRHSVLAYVFAEGEESACTDFAGTTNTAHGAWRSTRSATLPIRKRVTPWRPCVPMLMSCPWLDAPQPKIATAGSPATRRRSC